MMEWKKIYIFWILLVLTFSGCLPTEATSKPDTKETEATETSTLSPLDENIRQLEITLESSSLTESQRTRAESLLMEAEQLATMSAAPTPSSTEVQKSVELHQTIESKHTPPAVPTLQLGIVESGPYFDAHTPRRIIVENIWQGTKSENRIIIYSGLLSPDYRSQAQPEATQHGAVYVRIENNDGSVDTSLHSTNEEIGALRIIEEKGNQLRLVSTGTQHLSSQEVVFSIEHRSFITIEESIFD